MRRAAFLIGVLPAVGSPPTCMFVRREHDIDGEDRSPAGLRPDMHGMVKQGRQALNDGQPEAEAETAVTGGIAELVIFAED